MRNYCYPLLSHSFECGTWWQVRYANPKVPASAARTDASFGQDVCTRLCAVICQGPLGIKGTLFSDVLYVKVHVKDHPSFSPFSSRIFLICACLTLVDSFASFWSCIPSSPRCIFFSRRREWRYRSLTKPKVGNGRSGAKNRYWYRQASIITVSLLHIYTLSVIRKKKGKMIFSLILFHHWSMSLKRHVRYTRKAPERSLVCQPSYCAHTLNLPFAFGVENDQWRPISPSNQNMAMTRCLICLPLSQR